jgi:DNA-binding NtrC family response regulator
MTAALGLCDTSWPTDLPALIGASPSIQLARRRIEQFARTSLPVLLVGPTGSGKELLAQHLHALSGRSGDLVDVNCGALPREMIESLLFGHRRGAFSGAVESTTGLIIRAHHGTLFLDELASLPAEGQAKLLRSLETGEVLPLGESTKRRSDFRVIGAVQEDIDARVSSGAFRRDLFHRIAGIRIELPALAERRQDIALLATHFAHAQGCTISPAALALLRSQPWPGNVRELRATVDRAAVLSVNSLLEADTVAESIAPCTGNPLVPPAHSNLVRLCRAHGGRAAPIAADLGISRATLFRRLKAMGISLVGLRTQAMLEHR